MWSGHRGPSLPSIPLESFEPIFQAETQLVSVNCTTDTELFSVSCRDVMFDVRLKEGCLLSDASHPHLRQDFTDSFYISRHGYSDQLLVLIGLYESLFVCRWQKDHVIHRIIWSYKSGSIGHLWTTKPIPSYSEYFVYENAKTKVVLLSRPSDFLRVFVVSREHTSHEPV